MLMERAIGGLRRERQLRPPRLTKISLKVGSLVREPSMYSVS